MWLTDIRAYPSHIRELSVDMRIGIDCRTILNPGYGEKAGIGHYTYYLVTNLLRLDVENEYILFFDSRLNRDAAARLLGGHPKAGARFFPFHQYRHLVPFAYSHLLVSSIIAREKLDLYHLPAGAAPLFYPGKTVVTVHDLAIYRHPEWFPRQALATKVSFPKTVASASKIIAVSNQTKEDLMELLSVPQDKIVVVPEGVIAEPHEVLTEDVFSPSDYLDAEDIQRIYGLAKRYVLFVGTIEPRKNLGTLVRAYAAMVKEDRSLAEVELVIAGAAGAKSGPIQKEIAAANRASGGKIKIIGYVPHRDKFALMRCAEVFVYPSLYEGFGLPVLEAMAQGTPVLTSNVSALPEVADEAAVLVNPRSSEAIGQALRPLLTDQSLREDLKKRGRERIKLFSWEKTARETLGVYKSIL